MQTFQHNQWTREQFEVMSNLALKAERAKFLDRDYVGFIRTKDGIERDWLLACVPAGNA